MSGFFESGKLELQSRNGLGEGLFFAPVFSDKQKHFQLFNSFFELLLALF